jgi:two-component system, NarL family, sensor histidine kinase DesK
MNGSTSTIFRVVGLVACLVAVVPKFITAPFAGPDRTDYSVTDFLGLGADKVEVVFWAVLLLQLLGVMAFASAFWASMRPQSPPIRQRVALLLAQILLGMVTVPDLLLIISAELPFVLPMRAALAWLAAQSLGFALLAALAVDRLNFSITASIGTETVPINKAAFPPIEVIFVMDLFTAVAWQAFAFCMGYIAAAERRTRAKLASANAELMSTQQLLAESVRATERLRIARDLHDGLGHYLTALGLHLDLAARQAEGIGGEPIRISRDIARQLLVEVRMAVGAERMAQPIDLRQVLQTLCSGIPTPHVELNFDTRVVISDPSLAQVIFRSVQEAISNAVRHAAASRVEVALSGDAGGLQAIISDDGIGAPDLRLGNGLSGMKERVEEYGGRMEVISGIDRGFTVRVWLPQQEKYQ